MGLLNVIKNEVKAAVNYQQDFTGLLDSHDVGRAIGMMKCRADEAVENLKAYNVATHKIMEREDRAIYDKKGNFLRWSKRNKLPIPDQKFINEISVVFLYGRAPKWSQLSKGTDDAFSNFIDLNKEIRFNSAIKEAKRHAGAEGCSAILYHVFKNDAEQPELKLSVLSKSNNDDIYTMKDQYGKLTAFAWGFYLTESGGRTKYHVDVYTSEKIYRCTRASIGWEVEMYVNQVGKIPVLVFEQEPEAADVQHLIERRESMESTEADVIDRNSNPALIASSEIINSLPKAEDEAKLFIMKDGGDVKYLTWNQASEAKANQLERLRKYIMTKSFTPDIDFETMKSLGAMSAKAIRKVMFLAVIKAEKHKEHHDEYMSRHLSLMKAIMGNVLDYRNKDAYEALQAEHTFQDPFGDDVSDYLADLSKQYNDGALSKESYVEQSYLVKDPKLEMERIAKEQQEAMERQMAMERMDAFGQAE